MLLVKKATVATTHHLCILHSQCKVNFQQNSYCCCCASEVVVVAAVVVCGREWTSVVVGWLAGWVMLPSGQISISIYHHNHVVVIDVAVSVTTWSWLCWPLFFFGWLVVALVMLIQWGCWLAGMLAVRLVAAAYIVHIFSSCCFFLSFQNSKLVGIVVVATKLDVTTSGGVAMTFAVTSFITWPIWKSLICLKGLLVVLVLGNFRVNIFAVTKMSLGRTERRRKESDTSKRNEQ